MRTTPTNAAEAFIGLPPLDLVIQGETKVSAHRLRSPGNWSYLRPSRGHSSILVRLQESEFIFNIRVYVMRPAYNFKPKYSVTVLTREDWTTGTGTLPMIKVHVWFTDGSRIRGGRGAGVYGHSMKRRLSFPQ
jgi:hypothetical protein